MVGPVDSPSGHTLKPQAKCLQMARKKEGVGWEPCYQDRDFVSWWEEDGNGSGSGGRRHRFAGEAVSQDH